MKSDVEVKIEESEKAGSHQESDTSGLSHQYSATKPWQPDDHQPPQSSICTTGKWIVPPVQYR